MFCLRNDISPYKKQEYEKLKEECLKSNTLFEDPLFPAINESIFKNKPVPAGLKWRRPKRAFENPQFVVDSFDHTDIDQGSIGNCWFIAAVAGIIQNDLLFSKVVPKNQSFTKDYAGIFHFRFWLYGRWVDVVIDDRLPYVNGKLIFSSNKQSTNELWCPLLEKAYAKLYGSYEKLIGGHIYNAFIDMSGGIQEKIRLNKNSDDFQKAKIWSIISKAIKKGALMGCSIDPDPNIVEHKLSNGLIKGHAYTITDITEVLTYDQTIHLLRIRNPWGNEFEWNGAWCDNSPEWNSMSDEEKDSLGLINKSDGEFWMSYEDFLQNWEHIGICHLTPDSISDELMEFDDDSDLQWKCNFYNGSWKIGSTAGGSTGSDYWNNPKYYINLKDVDDNDFEYKATVVISLMQKDGPNKPGKFYIQFRLYKIPDNMEIPDKENINISPSHLEKVGTSGSYLNTREVCCRFRVTPGKYIIIPSTFKENEESDFLVRIFTEIRKTN